MNSHYLKNTDDKKIAELAKPFFLNKKIDISNSKKYLLIINHVKQRVNTLAEMPEESKGFYKNPNFSNDQLKILNKNESQKLLQTILAKLKNEFNCDGDTFKNISMAAGKECNLKGKDLFYPLRIAIFGNSDGPDIPIIYSILEKNEIITRLSKAIND